MTDRLYQRSPSILFGEIGDDVVALSVSRGLCYGMENVTATVWGLLEEPRSLNHICNALAQQYEVDPNRCRDEVAALLSQMQEEGLVEPTAP